MSDALGHKMPLLQGETLGIFILPVFGHCLNCFVLSEHSIMLIKLITLIQLINFINFITLLTLLTLLTKCQIRNCSRIIT